MRYDCNFNSLLFRQTHLLGYVENKKNTLCMYYNKNKYTIHLENKKNTICMETYGPPCTFTSNFSQHCGGIFSLLTIDAILECALNLFGSQKHFSSSISSHQIGTIATEVIEINSTIAYEQLAIMH